MKRTLIGCIVGPRELLGARKSGTVLVQGFVEAVRDQKRMVFLTLRDPSGVVQIVHDKTEGDMTVSAALAEVTVGSALSVTGEIVENAQVKLGGVEIRATGIVIAGKAEAPLPIDPLSSSEKQLDWRYLSLREPRNLLTFKVQTALERGMRAFWGEHDFIEIHSPKLLATASESGAELFKIQYFDTQACLAQSPQFYKQMAMAAGFDRVFEIGPVFRANPSHTSRHDTEFTSVDMEISWIESHEDVMALEERWIVHVLTYVRAAHGEDIRREFGVEVIVPSLPFPRVTLAQAREILARQGHTIPHKDDLDPEGERRLAHYIKQQFGHEFVFVTDYPTSVRPFYHMRSPFDLTLTKSFDLLWKGLEITTGAQREHRHEILVRQAEEKGMDLGPLQDYLNFFRYGCPPHGGMGIGLTRLLMVLLDRSNVREVTYLYRGPNRLRP